MSDSQPPKPASLMPPPPVAAKEVVAVEAVEDTAIILVGYATLPEPEKALIKGHYFAAEHVSVRLIARCYRLHRTSLHRVATRESWAIERVKLYNSAAAADFKNSYMKRLRTLQSILQTEAEHHLESSMLAFEDGLNNEAAFSYARFKDFLKFQRECQLDIVEGGHFGGMSARGSEPMMKLNLPDNPKLTSVLNVVLQMISARPKPNVDSLDPAIIDAEARAIDPAKGERR